MAQSRVDLYDSHYAKLEAAVYAAIRQDVYGENVGQTGWITMADARGFFEDMALAPGRRGLDVACGSGGLTRAMVQETGATAIGVDINPFAIEAATRHATESDLGDSVEFRVVDAGSDLPFEAEAFDAVLCNDAINHIPDRPHLFRDWMRVLRPGGRVLFTDPIIVTGQLTKEEIETRSSIGYFLFTPVGVNERLLEAAGFTVLDVKDMTEEVATIAGRWHQARAERRQAVVALEGEEEFAGLQRFFQIVTRLAGERRLSRFRFLAEKR